MSEQRADVGLIGLGAMGRPMAAHLLRAARERGVDLVVNSRRQSSAAGLVADGAHWAPTPREVAARCEVVLTMLPDLPELAEILDGDDGLLAGLAGPTVLVVSSTSSPDGVRDLARDLADRTGRRLAVVDAPVSGGVEGAADGTLSIMVGGADDDVATVLPWLEALGTPVHLGPVGAGQVAKACNQLIVAATTVALGEASVIAERAGLDLGRLLDLLGGGYAGSRVLEVKKSRLVAHDHTPASPARFMIKDLAFAAAEAERTGTAVEQLPVLQRVYEQLTEQGLGDLDSSVVQRYVEERSI
ncbi:NAD(P)-dependent oxidoreductase [Georgenia sp. EYE_87]|uniref:NAD(P)-dependent oxidoreductase n=1 Tax=Georgenia sp. EYE_87 TaxID=2853448 RepID=UPI00200577DA|nr:NAD(P)-dependent oxidoreductase [Georgenia sp. EYE_87]MCK6210212.1 NAD(P)-dependent oxidoreductase [Georgenia sp. EYE_87]